MRESERACVWKEEGGTEAACASTRNLPHSRLQTLCSSSPPFSFLSPCVVFFFYIFFFLPFIFFLALSCSLLSLSSRYSCSSAAFRSCVACWGWHLQFWGAGPGCPLASLSNPARSCASRLPGPGSALSRLVLQQSINSIGKIWVSATCLPLYFWA